MPNRSQDTSARILASAERLFAEHGYDGVSMRQIADDADAQLALIHYHFGNKLDLYRAIWTARYPAEIARAREGRFETLDFSAPRVSLLRDLVELFLRPIVGMTQVEELRDFAVIGARECVDPHEAERGMLDEFLDPSAKRFIQSFQTALPELSPQDVAWGYQAMAGVSVLSMADRSRLSRISQGAAKAGDGATAIEPLIDFCLGGWLNLVASRNKKTAKIHPLSKISQPKKA